MPAAAGRGKLLAALGMRRAGRLLPFARQPHARRTASDHNRFAPAGVIAIPQASAMVDNTAGRRGPNVVVGGAEDAEAAGGDDPVALGVVLPAFVVDRPVQFDDESGRVAGEVGDEAVDDLLAAEVEADQSVATQTLPQGRLVRRQGAAQALARSSLAGSTTWPMTTLRGTRRLRCGSGTYPPRPPFPTREGGSKWGRIFGTNGQDSERLTPLAPPFPRREGGPGG